FSRIVGVLCLVVLAGVVIPIILSWTMGEPHAALALCLEGLCAALAFWLSRQGRPQAAAMLLSLSLLACAECLLFTTDEGFQGLSTMLMFPALLMPAAILLERRLYTGFAALTVLAVTAAGIADMHGLTGAAAALGAHTHWNMLCDIDVILIVTAVAGGLMAQHLRRSLSESRRNASALRAIARATTGGGAAFHGGLVSELARAVGVGNAMLAELLPGTPRRARTVALFDHGELAPNFEFNLAGTPFDELLQSGFAHYPRDVQKRFAQDRQ